MPTVLKELEKFLAQPSLALVEVACAKGSTPRDAGAWMLVSRKAIFGTIGGGQLEYMAIDKAREMLRSLSPLEGEMSPQATEGVPSEGTSIRPSTTASTPPGRFAATLPSRGREKLLDIPLGPEIGQCCGGRVEVAIRCVDKLLASDLIARAKAEEADLPHVYVFGGGHVGHALAGALSLLPLRTVVVETRAEELAGLPDEVETRLTAVPEEVVREAPSGSAFLVLTHDHALDFLIVSEALNRTDAAYVGMIGSQTKKATFRNWFLKNAGGTEAEFARLVSPIGGDTVKDKRPAVIASLAAAELVTVLLGAPAQAQVNA
jgi:xanthine dehydrogenase accessory factor